MTSATGLEVSRLTHRYGEHRALEEVSFALDDGITALIGVNGAGKTTLMSAVSGAMRPTSGRVAVTGLDPYRSRGRRVALGRLALMPQTVRFPGNMTALEVVEYLTWMRGVSGGRARDLARQALGRVRLSDRADTKVRELSGGMVRRVALAQAVASLPKLLLLDEPSTGLDPRQRRTMVELIAELAADQDTTVLFSSHVMEDVSDVAARVVVLDEGRLLFDGTVAELSGRAPAGTPEGKVAEAGFLQVLAGDRSGSPGC